MQLSSFIADLPRPSLFDREDPCLQRARLNFPDWLAGGLYHSVSRPALYVVKIEEKNFPPGYGLCGLVETAEFSGDTGLIRPHEAILKAREARQREAYLRDSHLIKPVLLTCSPFAELEMALQQLAASLEPAVCHDDEALSTRISIYVIQEVSELNRLKKLMKTLPLPIAVADGHHRISTAKKLALEADYRGTLAKIPVVLLPYNALRIDSYIRSIAAVERSEAEVLLELAHFFEIKEVNEAHRPREEGDWLLAKGQSFYRLTNRDGYFLPDCVWFDQLVLPKVFGIMDSTSDDRLTAVPAEEGTLEVLALAEKQALDWHFLPPPVTAAAFITFIQEKKIFPPKSTRFLPRLPSGLITYRLSPDQTQHNDEIS
jgi:uncharacterized protein (DUF1015 family)